MLFTHCKTHTSEHNNLTSLLESNIFLSTLSSDKLL
jgi:hypothetical protein